MSDLAAFLLARIAEDQEHAYETCDIQRALAECQAKRRIVELHDERGRGGGCSSCASDGWASDGFSGVVPDAWPCNTLRALALPYADHPGFDPSLGVPEQNKEQRP